MTTSAPQHILPEFHLLCLDPRFPPAFLAAEKAHFPNLRSHTPNVTIHNGALEHLRPDLSFSAVVSPANSYARLDGTFDDALARTYGPSDDYDWITRKAQKVLYAEWRGFAPPGTCTVVRLDHDDEKVTNPWQTEYLLLCPTMRIPHDVRWDREVVYECIWSMLCAIDKHNRRVRSGEAGEGETEIRSVLMTPLGTGVGRIRPERWAAQCVLALKYFVESCSKPEVWGNLDWRKIFDDHEAVVNTWDDQN